MDWDNKKTTNSQMHLRLIAGGVALLGVIMIGGAGYLQEYLPWELPGEVIKQAGAAFLIASTLAVTVHLALAADMAKDAFYASFRYVLPEEMKDEVKRIINYRFLAIEHRAVVEISEIDDDLVRVNISTERKLRNISRHAERICNLFAVDEWGFPGHQSTIDECTMKFGGEIINSEVNPEYADRDDALGRETEERKIKPGETVIFISRGTEVHRNNGVLFLGFGGPTLKPVLDIRVPIGFKHRCSFGVPGEQFESSEITNRYCLDGTRFSGQNARIRWWKEAR